jgi:sugar phosphate isomerase/epimerase
MNPRTAPVIGVSSWSLHRAIGLSWWESPSAPAVRKEAWGKGTLPVLDLPAAAAGNGIDRIHLCHFHVESRDKSWCAEFRSALARAGVTLSMLLVDDGDITDPEHHARDLAWVAGWIDTAAHLGAGTARIVAGKQKPTPEAIRMSIDGLRSLVGRGRAEGVRIATENWHDLLSGPAEVDAVLDGVGDGLELLADFGNWKGPSKYDDLARIISRASDTHAKASFDADGIDADDFGACLAIADAAGYDGAYTLIYDGPDNDEWASIAVEQQFVTRYLAGETRRLA